MRERRRWLEGNTGECLDHVDVDLVHHSQHPLAGEFRLSHLGRGVRPEPCPPSRIKAGLDSKTRVLTPCPRKIPMG